MLTRRRLLGSLVGALAAALSPIRWQPAVAAPAPVPQGMTATWWQRGTVAGFPVLPEVDRWYHCAIVDDGQGHRVRYIDGQLTSIEFPWPSPPGAPLFAEFDEVLDVATIRRHVKSA